MVTTPTPTPPRVRKPVPIGPILLQIMQALAVPDATPTARIDRCFRVLAEQIPEAPAVKLAMAAHLIATEAGDAYGVRHFAAQLALETATEAADGPAAPEAALAGMQTLALVLLALRANLS